MKTEKFHIEFLFDCIRKIEKYTSGVSEEDFWKNEEKQSAVIMQLTLVGETSKNLSEEIKSNIDLPWKEIAGFRDVAIHDYSDLDLKIVWAAAKNRIPELKQKLTEYLSKS